MATNIEAQNAMMKLETTAISIGHLIQQIEKQTDYLVVFRNREVDTERTIQVHNKSDKVLSYLKDAFEGTDIRYEFTNKYILLSKKSHTERVNIQYLRVYLSGQNLATITGYDGFDPEGGWYPLARTFSLGFNLQF